VRRDVTYAGRGFTIIELVITLALFGVLLGLGIPAFTTFIQNAQIRNAAENAMTGINLARAEAVQRNSTVRFQLVTNLTSSCALSQSSGTWVVSQDSAAGLCDVAPSETVTPRTIRKQSAQEGSAKVAVTATGSSSIVFNGLGRVVGTGISQIDINHSTLTCEHVDLVNGSARCLRILVSTGGLAKLCDPKMAVTTDPRYCN
jgi:type IV fimbrial biogenesis protein FimT